jgi:hypothetical protein
MRSKCATGVDTKGGKGRRSGRGLFRGRGLSQGEIFFLESFKTCRNIPAKQGRQHRGHDGDGQGGWIAKPMNMVHAHTPFPVAKKKLHLPLVFRHFDGS